MSDIEMKGGTTELLPVKMDIDISTVDSIIFDIKGNGLVQKVYPDEVSYSNGIFLVPLNQQDTIDLEGTRAVIEAQINLNEDFGHAVKKSKLGSFVVCKTVNTTMVEGSTPAAYDLQEITLEILDNIIIAKVNPAEVQKEIEDVDKQMQVLLAGYEEELETKYENDIGALRRAMGNTVLSVENGHLTFTD